MEQHKLTDKDRGSRAASSLICKSRLKRMDVLAFGARNDLTVEYLEGATDAFHRQGPALWGWWCTAMRIRVKGGLVVPALFKL